MNKNQRCALKALDLRKNLEEPILEITKLLKNMFLNLRGIWSAFKSLDKLIE